MDRVSVRGNPLSGILSGSTEEARELFSEMIREISSLADAMGVGFERDALQVNLQILSGLSPESDTSMQRDVAAGRPSEVDGLVCQVVRLAHQYGGPCRSTR